MGEVTTQEQVRLIAAGMVAILLVAGCLVGSLMWVFASVESVVADIVLGGFAGAATLLALFLLVKLALAMYMVVRTAREAVRGTKRRGARNSEVHVMEAAAHRGTETAKKADPVDGVET